MSKKPIGLGSPLKELLRSHPTCWLTGDVNSAWLGFIQNTIKDTNPTEPVVIFISSNGGDDEVGFGAIDILRASERKVITIGIGKVMSSAVDIFLAGDRRITMPNTTYCIHESHLDSGELENAEGFRRRIARCEYSDTRGNKYIMARSKMNKKQLAAFAGEGYYFDSRRALKWGIATEIAKGRTWQKTLHKGM